MQRRSFFLGLGSALALPALAAQQLPTIYGDGVHCDADGVIAALLNKPHVNLSSAEIMHDQHVYSYRSGRWASSKFSTVIKNGKFRFLKTLDFVEHEVRNSMFYHNTLVMDYPNRVAYVKMDFSNSNVIQYCIFTDQWDPTETQRLARSSWMPAWESA